MKAPKRCKTVLSVLIVVLLPIALLGQTENWVYRYNGPGDSWDRALSIVYGADGNIYAAGYVYGIYGNRPDFAVISLPSSGPPENWVYAYQEQVNSYNQARSIVYGSDGNLYGAGYAYETVAHASDFTVISLTTSGSERWAYLYDGGGGAADYAYSVCYGADGNVYGAGNTWYGGGRYWDFTIISLPPSGPPQNWVYKYDGPGSEMDNSDAAYSIVYGSDNNIYAAGKSYGSGTWRDFTVVSVTNSGTGRWVYRNNGSANLDDVARSVIYGDDGNIYVTGTIRNSNNDIIVVSLPSSGPPANWVYIYNGTGDGSDGGSSITYGSDGNIYVAGSSTGSGTGSDFMVLSFTASGDTNWTYRYNGPGNGSDGASSIVYGSDGNIYASGNSEGSGTDRDFTVVSLTTSGTENWVYRYNGPADTTDISYSIAYGSDGNIYAAGYSGGIGTDEDFTVISLSPDLCVEEKEITHVRKYNLGATIFSGPLQLPESKKCKVFDVTGRIVAPDKIQSGIYFIEIDGVVTQKVVKVR